MRSSMNLESFNSKDFWAGLMLIAIGGAALFIARDYPFGTALRMGPGYFPTVLGAHPVAVRRCIWPSGAAHGERSRRLVAARADRPALSLVLFGVLMDRAGFVPAMLVLIFGSAPPAREFRLVEVLLLARRADRALGVGVRLGRSACPTR